MLDRTVPENGLQTDLARRGRLDLSFARAPDGRSFLDRQFSSYPFHLCRPFYLDDGPTKGMASIYTQSCSGGLYSGDRLTTVLQVGAGAQAQVTSQASTIILRATYGGAVQSCDIGAGPGALVEYLPEATILFPGARLQSSTRLQVHSTASAILFDSFLAHDPTRSGETFEVFENDLQVQTPKGRPLAIDRFRVTGSDFLQSERGRMGGFRCHGNVIVLAPAIDIEACIETARRAVGGQKDCVVGVSRLSLVNGFSARILARDAFLVRRTTLELWALARAAITGQPPGPRRK
jgi:urease accessory protein